jgi:hypothetical protein
MPSDRPTEAEQNLRPSATTSGLSMSPHTRCMIEAAARVFVINRMSRASMDTRPADICGLPPKAGEATCKAMTATGSVVRRHIARSAVRAGAPRCHGVAGRHVLAAIVAPVSEPTIYGMPDACFMARRLFAGKDRRTHR